MNKQIMIRFGTFFGAAILWLTATNLLLQKTEAQSVAMPQDLPRFKIIDAQNDINFRLQIMVAEDQKTGCSYLVVRSSSGGSGPDPIQVLPISK